MDALFLTKIKFERHKGLKNGVSELVLFEPRHLPKEGKKAKFPHNTMKEGRLKISLTRILCLFVSKI